MDVELTSDQEFLRQTVQQFLEAEMPLTAVRELEEHAEGFECAWWRQAAELGWVSMLVPEELGGGSVSGEGLVDLVLIAEEQGRLVSPGPLLESNVVAFALASSGSAEQQEKVLPALITGEEIATWCFAEPGAPFGAAGVQLAAEETESGFRLDGAKTHVASGVGADWLLVTARSGDGLSQFLVAADTPGVSSSPRKSLDLVRRFAGVRFEGVEVPESALVGSVGAAADLVERQLQVALVLQCAEMAGAADRVFEFTAAYAQDRYSFGRPLASYQALKHRFADMKMQLEASHGTTTAATKAVQREDARAAELASVAKAYLGQFLPELCQDCVQLHGGIGLTWEHDIHLYLRRLTVDKALYGSPAEHRERLASLLGM